MANRVEAPLERPVARRRAPPLLWLLGVLVVLPAAVPVGYLLWSVLATGGFDSGGIPVHRLIDLMWSTGLLVISVTATTTVLGMATAWLTTRTDLPARRVWSTLVTLPLVFPSYVGALALLGASGRQGLLSVVLEPFGLGPVPVFDGFWAAWLALSLWNFSFVHLLVSPILRRIDPRLEDAAHGLGAGRRRVFATVILPQLRPALTAGALLVALYTLSDFGAVSLLRYETFTRAIYTQFRARLDLSPALFLSGVLIMVALVLVAAEQRSRGKVAVQGPAPRRAPTLERLTPTFRLAAISFLGTIVAAGLLLPIATLVWWVVRGLTLGNPLGNLVDETIGSAITGALGGFATMAAAVPLAVLTVRYRSRLAGGIESLAWATYSLPHLAVGLGFLVLGIRLLPLIYQKLPLLVLAYVAMFLPQALAAAQAGLRQVSPSLEEASRNLGRTSVATFFRVTGPLVAPSLLSGGALVFLTVMKELPATLILRPTEFETLAIRIWSASSELFYTQASAAALVLLAVSAGPLYLLTTRGHRES